MGRFYSHCVYCALLFFDDLGLGHGAFRFFLRTCAPYLLDGELLDVAADFKADFCFDLAF
jgi:hypothetical protein